MIFLCNYIFFQKRHTQRFYTQRLNVFSPKYCLRKLTCIKNISKLILLFISRTIGHIFPQYIRAPSDSNAKPIDQFYKGMSTYSMPSSDCCTFNINTTLMLLCRNSINIIVLINKNVLIKYCYIFSVP